MNRVMLIGYVGIEPEVKYYEADQAVATLRFATTEKGYTLQNGTHVPDRTDWHNLVFYRRLAKVVENYVHKGDKLYVDGKLQYRRYDDKKGIQHIVTEIIVENMEMLTPRQTMQTSQQQPANAGGNIQPQQAGQIEKNVQNQTSDIESNNKIMPF